MSLYKFPQMSSEEELEKENMPLLATQLKNTTEHVAWLAWAAGLGWANWITKLNWATVMISEVGDEIGGEGEMRKRSSLWPQAFNIWSEEIKITHNTTWNIKLQQISKHNVAKMRTFPSFPFSSLSEKVTFFRKSPLTFRLHGFFYAPLL